MSIYAQMRSSIDTAMPDRVAEQMVHRQLQNVVENLGWTYVALWSLNRQTRNLGWMGGHFRMNSTAVTGGHGGSEVWNEQLFDSTYKSCQFTSNLGSVGTAHADGRNIWMNGPSVLKHAGSKEQADFLQHARIATAVCIPWTDGVLELGTCESLPENPELMETILQFVLEHIVPVLGELPSGHSTSLMAGTSQTPSGHHFRRSSFPAPRSMVHQNGPFSSLNTLRSHMSADLSSPSFEPNSLNQQVRRAASLSSLNADIFLQHLEDGEKDQAAAANDMDADALLTHPDSNPWSRLPATSTTPPQRASDPALPISALTVAPNPAFQYYPPAQQTARGQYRSRTSTTSSSVSSLEDGSGKHSTVNSPEQTNMTTFGASSHRRASHSTTSSSPTRGTSSHSPEIMNPLEDVSATKAPASNLQDDDIQTAISLMLAEGDDQESQWRNMCASPLETPTMSQMNLLESASANGNHTTSSLFNSPHCNAMSTHGAAAQALSSSTRVTPSQGQFKSWRHTRILAPILRKDNRTNQELLRRCIEMMKQIPNLQQGAQAQTNGSSAGQGTVTPSAAPIGPSSSSPEEPAADTGFANDPFDQPGPPRVQRRPRGGSRIASMGPVHIGHDEAALNHMMAERRRRVKQKENFAALRRLVPIISKADKASILGDAIVYLQDLQDQIKALEASRDAAQRRFEALQVSYKELEDRNKELESMVAGTGNASTLAQQRSGATRGPHSTLLSFSSH